MRAVFKLNNTQTAAAATATAAAAAAAAADATVMNCGIYTVASEEYVNRDQSVRLVNDTLVIDGQRCALAFDGGFAAAKEILKPGQKPVEYKTSDRRLCWDETLYSYMKNRATRAEKLAYLEQDPEVCVARTLFPELMGSVLLAYKNYQRACAELDSSTLQTCRRIIYLVQH
jgi:hypothetical protein